MAADELICGDEAVLAMLDGWFAGRSDDWWEGFYADRDKPVPFFGDAPDECLAQWVDEHAAASGRALDIGCGNGRNARFLAARGFDVDGVDYAQAAIDWATQRAAELGVAVRWHCRSVFDLDLPVGGFDLAYDSGCFHHLAPHRRHTYVKRVREALRPGGWFGLVCFRPEGGSGLTDEQVYERRSVGGGLGYTEAQLRAIWSTGLEVHSTRRMLKPPPGADVFGEEFLSVLWARKPVDAAGR
ncbi:class I SAM-dependent methyltransferase [Rhizobacter sp. SG703]|uniref:class I SAM-dependent methyltransferase n=1 Tax=Rhizobacter sp. SG703 TaxID=2587140 RepID=UPI001445792D|nr:class I SAM-dependent methyltransferase [Rhizobacter sp. SG703]NKI95950.1 SAM-dependent methyltransferase [Rhizobacter sp. SG703]